LAEQDRKIVSVRVTPDGFVVGGSDASDPRIPCQGPCAPDGYDFTALNQAMIVAKRSHPGENRVVIAADPSIPYAVLIGVMDATRAERDGARRPLFPSPLIAAPEAR
jgi:biopolymer transport protein ExbD